jgi:hypothetical protein
MPYFSDTSSAPKIVDEVSPRYDEFWTGLGVGGAEGRAHSWRIITTQSYHLAGLTEACAVAAAGTSADTWYHQTKSAVRQSADGAFALRVTRDSWTDWTRDTYAV